MPINSVRNPLLNPHESTVLVFTIEDLQTFTRSDTNSYRDTQKRRKRSNNYMGEGEGADGFYLRCDGAGTVNERERERERAERVGVINN
jgi:hypothetical protein